MATVVKVSPEDIKSASKIGTEHIPEPCIVVIFGASGDLTKRKLLPALYHLQQAKLLPEEFAVVGVARRDLGEEFKKEMREGIVKFGGRRQRRCQTRRFHKEAGLPRAGVRR